MKFIYMLILFIILMSLIKFLNKYLTTLREKLNKQHTYERITYGFASTKDFYEFSFSEFDNFCINFLNQLGYFNIHEIHETTEGGVTYSATKDNEIFYIHMLFNDIDSEDDDETPKYIGRPCVQKFVGAMAVDKITNGIIITNGIVNDNSINYIQNIPKEYSLTYFDGKKLCETLWNMRNC